MVGKIKDVVPSTEAEGRWLIQMSEYATIDLPDEWQGRNPVAYWTTDDYELDFEGLDFKPIGKPAIGLSISEAKAGLAIGLNVPETAIEITVRF